MPKVVFLNPRTCGIYKDGGPRYKTDANTGLRTAQVDNELIDSVDSYLEGATPPGAASVDLLTVFERRVLVPTYYDKRYNDKFEKLISNNKLEPISLGELIRNKTISAHGGHGSPGNDQRSGHIPYVKVSDIRGLRININPTNLVTESVARRFWKGNESGLEAWDLITPNRASSNIGEFAILLPGEERIVLTKEVFIFRIVSDKLIDPYYLLWALSLKSVRDQWRRVALMQTNREDCGSRYKEVLIPKPKSKQWAADASSAFREYFRALAGAKARFADAVSQGTFEYVANVAATVPVTEAEAQAMGDEEPKDADAIRADQSE